MRTSAIGTLATLPAARAGGSPARLWLAAGGLAAFGVLLLTRPYRGVVHDAVIYVGRALADGDPTGLGRDILFAHDGQSRFSAFPALLRALTEAFGPSAAPASLAAIGLALWFGALGLLLARLMPGRLVPAGLLAALSLPPFYGAFGIFRYGEPFATPRTLAEAAVLAALACLAARRTAPTVAFLLAAALFHPIMAASGIAVALLVAAAADRRWLVLGAAGAAALLAAALAGLPFAHRLLATVDPAWEAGLRANAYLFPSLWPADVWAAVAARAATLVLALRLLPGVAPPIAASVLIVAIGGVALTWLLADLWLLVLPAQAQPWRGLWLLSLLAAASLPLVAVAAWQAGSGARIAAACLGFAWLTPASPVAACAAAALAVALDAASRHRPELVGPRVANAAWIAVAGLLALLWLPRAATAVLLWLGKPPGAGSSVEVWSVWLPLAVGAAFWAVSDRLRPPPAIAAAGGAGLALLGVATWDDRSPLSRQLDAMRPDPALVRLVPSEPGPVLWLQHGAHKAWALAGRPNWISYVQGAPMVFSRDLATVWQDRVARLQAARLGDEGDRIPHLTAAGPALRPSREDLAGFCAAPDAPVAIVVPNNGHVVLPEGVTAAPYRLPFPDYDIGERDGRPVWNAHEALSVILCRDLVAGRPPGAGLRSALDAG